MSTAEELKIKGNESYAAEAYMEAIDLYTEAIKLEPNNYKYYSNRSAAYLKDGQPTKALVDAEKSLELSPGYLKGYSRKGAALHALKKYNEAITTFEAGLAKFPSDPILKKQLENVKKDKSKSLGTSKVTSIKQTSISTNKKQKDSSNVSEFVKYAKSNLQLQILELQSQMKMIDELSQMSDKEKLELIFELLDADGDGYVDAKELSDGIRRRNEGMSFEEGLERAITMVALFDKENNQKLSLSEFETLTKALLSELGVTFHELSEFLVLQLIFSDGGNDVSETIATQLMSDEINDAVKEESEFYKVLTDDRMLALYHLFDIDGDGVVNFPEVAIGLYKLSDDMESSSKAAIELLLSCDVDDTRTLDYEQFARLILNVTAASGNDVKFTDIADALTVAMAKGPTTLDENEMAQLIIADELYQATADVKEEIQEQMEIMGVLQYSKLHKLFDLWDINNDGYIDYEELLLGMRKFQQAYSIEESIQEAAITMLAFDKDENQKLDKEEFALAIIKYSDGIPSVSLPDMIDFMCVTSLLKDNTIEEEEYIKAISSQATRDVALLQDILSSVELIAIE